ncbi:D-alanine--D-alanine ligase [Robiginitalea sp. IMCC43444]|uniref:D-alanine--D-alanine ligase n=1 Tax=Robiginitalea sp. IMCC43444 TaxID=3459121 RepID=UPI00404243D9
MKKKIAIVMGGFSSEYGISMQSGQVVYESLDRNRYEPYRVVISKDKWVLLDDKEAEIPIDRHDFSAVLSGDTLHFDCVFNAIHGSPGEDGMLQAYFELLEMPHTSCGYYQAALTFNKRDLLRVLKAYGIPCAPSYSLDMGQEVREAEIISTVGLPCFVKANRAGSSFGISLVRKAEELGRALEVAFKEDQQVLIEKALEGTEVSVGVIRYQGKTTVLPITEIVSENDFFDYAAKYEGKSQEITPARIKAEVHRKVADMAEFIYDVLKMEGYSRSEFIVVDGIPHLLEMNTTPGLTRASILPQQAREAGISMPELFGSAIEEALGKKP